MRIWTIRLVLILMWLLATHGALEVVGNLAGRSDWLGAVGFLAVTAGMIWLAVHLGDVPIWKGGPGGPAAGGNQDDES